MDTRKTCAARGIAALVAHGRAPVALAQGTGTVGPAATARTGTTGTASTADVRQEPAPPWGLLGLLGLGGLAPLFVRRRAEEPVAWPAERRAA
jgi:hypothetical protein